MPDGHGGRRNRGDPGHNEQGRDNGSGDAGVMGMGGEVWDTEGTLCRPEDCIHSTTGADIRGAIVRGVAADTIWEGMSEAGDRDCGGKLSSGQGTGRAQTWGKVPQARKARASMPAQVRMN
jgi:hypothetical protein